MASSRGPNSAVHWTRVKQRGSRVKPEVATVSLARRVFGGDWRARILTEQEQSNPGEFPKTLMPCASVHRYHACTWTRTYNSLYLLFNSFSLRLFVLQNSTDIARISFFSCCTTLKCSNISFSIYKFIIYIKIWQLYYHNTEWLIGKLFKSSKSSWMMKF